MNPGIPKIPKIRVAISRSCEMRCIYCPHGSAINMENYDGDNKYCLTTDELVAILSEMQKYGLEDVHLTGGEPLRRGDVISLASCLKSKGLRVELNTNGFSLTKEKATELKEAGIEFLKISLDTPNREAFRSFTGIDAFDKVVTGIKNALEVMPVRLNCVVMKSNFDSVIELLNLCNDLGVQEIHLLDLTYYPCYGNRKFWENEFVYLTKDLMPIIETEYGKKFEIMPIYGCRFYKLETRPGGTSVILKEAQPTMRIPKCADCQEYCHEGVFTLRMSAGGYVNFCPCSNVNGFNALDLYKEGKLGEAVLEMSSIFDQARPVDSFQEFVSRNQLSFK